MLNSVIIFVKPEPKARAVQCTMHNASNHIPTHIFNNSTICTFGSIMVTFNANQLKIPTTKSKKKKEEEENTRINDYLDIKSERLGRTGLMKPQKPMPKSIL